MRRLHPYFTKRKQRQASWLSRIVLFVLIFASLGAVIVMLRPFLAPIILALLLASIFYPLYRFIEKRLNGRRNIAAFVMVVIVSLLVIIPVLLFVSSLVDQGVEVFRHAKVWLENGNLEKAMEGEKVRELLEHPRVQKIRQFYMDHFMSGETTQLNIRGTLLRLSEGAIGYVSERILPVLTQAGLMIANFFIMLFVMFYAFRDGDRMLHYILGLFPLAATYEETLLERIGHLAKAVLLGIFLTAAVQAVVAMIAFKIVGIPALFWGVMLGLASLVPLVGTALIWVPAVIYLLIMGKIGAAIFLTLWCILVVGMVDNFLRPILMQGRSGMSTVVLFFAILGGLRLFGMIGIVYGPLIFGLCAVLLYIYRIENSETLAELQRQ
ncbi:MAG: AI-2E family transporter [Candidatus Pacebacteria bacterium]|nr:AI-2E family transporter [Candidatus Paceibacterota bacterium]